MPSCFIVKCLYRCEHVDEDFDKDGVVRRVSALCTFCVIPAYVGACGTSLMFPFDREFVFTSLAILVPLRPKVLSV